MSHGELLERLTKTSTPVPPMLAEAVGYTGQSRFVAIHWGGGDEAYYDDGMISATGEYAPYLLYLRHPAIWPHLVGFNFGNSDEDATHWLLLDREEEVAYAGAVRDVHALLVAQHPGVYAPAADVPVITWEEMLASFQEQQSVFQSLSGEEQMQIVSERMREHEQRYHALDEWLATQDRSRGDQLWQEYLAQLDTAIKEGKQPPRPPTIL